MATLRIIEYGNTQQEYGAPKEPPLVVQTAITPSGTSQQSSAFGATTQTVRLSAEIACSVIFGANPTAVTSTGIYLTAGSVVDFPVGLSSGLKVAVVT